jgi:nucleoside-diphosphate-sugar epimerase
MRVFVTGATGFIGSAVAAAFARAGHEVLGLTRRAEGGTTLAAHEVQPVVGNLDSPDGWTPIARSCQVLVHCAAESSDRSWDIHRSSTEALLSAARQSERPRAVLTTSGVWVHGNTGDDVKDESATLDPLPLVAPRPAIDDRVLEANGGRLRTLVIRPGCVYGGSGGLTGPWFESAVAEGAARMVGDGSNRWTMVHREDLARLYVLAAESSHGGEVFNATDRSRFTVRECAEAASRAAGAGGRVVETPLSEAAALYGPLAQGLAVSQHIDSGKAVRLLGWQPRHGGFADGARRYFLSWKAARP